VTARRWRYPRGTGALSPDQVRGFQRRRLLDAFVAVCAERGYGAATTTLVATEAGVSTASFYQIFADKQECMLAACHEQGERFAEALRAAWRTAYFSGKDECALAAYEAYSRQLATRLAVAWECADSLSGRVHAAADAALEFAARRPGAAHLLAEGVLAVGPDGLALQQGSLARLAAALHRERPLAAARASTLTEQVRIAGVAWLLSDPLRALDPDRLPEFSSQVTAVLLAPYGIPAEA